MSIIDFGTDVGPMCVECGATLWVYQQYTDDVIKRAMIIARCACCHSTSNFFVEPPKTHVVAVRLEHIKQRAEGRTT